MSTKQKHERKISNRKWWLWKSLPPLEDYHLIFNIDLKKMLVWSPREDSFRYKPNKEAHSIISKIYAVLLCFTNFHSLHFGFNEGAFTHPLSSQINVMEGEFLVGCTSGLSWSFYLLSFHLGSNTQCGTLSFDKWIVTDILLFLILMKKINILS